MRSQPSGDTELYLHLYDRLAEGGLRLPGLSNAVLSARLLPDGPEIETTLQGNSRVLRLPSSSGDGIRVVKIVIKGSPVIEVTASEPDRSGKLELQAGSAALAGKNLRLERQQDSPEPNLGYWTETGDSAAWKINLPTAGEYGCVWNVACDSASAGALIAIRNGNGEELGRFEVPSTGGWGLFRPVKGGSLSLPHGLTELRLAPLTKPGLGVVNLRSLTLEKIR